VLKVIHTHRRKQIRISIIEEINMKTIETPNAPKAIGPYSQAVRAGDFLFVSGQLGVIPETGEFAGDTAEAQTKQAIKNIGAILEAGGCSFEDVVDATIYLTNIEDFASVNAEYSKRFDAHKPARATIEVSNLPKAAKVEIRVTAFAN
jgi:2-iminobutanoate/2-iminopropanoate deaminase